MTPEKDYQQRSLKTLADFLRRCSKPLPVGTAFFEAQEANSITPSSYIPVMAPGLSLEMLVWGGALFGGVLYMSINMVIACFSGGNAFMQFFTTKAFVFPLVMGIIFSGLFCWFYKMLLKLWA